MPFAGCWAQPDMPQTSPIADYAALLARELAFDRGLARRVCCEVEDHLWAAAGESGEASVEAQRRAIARFGDPRAVAARYVPAALYGRIRRIGIAVLAVIAGAYFAMEGRVVWYGLFHWGVSASLRAAIGQALPVLRVAFVASVLLGLAGWGYGASRDMPRALGPLHRRQLWLAQSLCSAAAAAVMVSAAVDLALTALRLAETRWSAQALVPLGLIALEVALAGVLVWLLVGMVRRMRLSFEAAR